MSFMPSGVIAAAAVKLRASAMPPSTSGQSANFPIDTASVTVTALSGVPPYSYAWTKTQGSNATSVATSPTSNVTSFRATAGVNPGEAEQEVWTCTVTDTASQQVLVDVPVTFERSN